jgi:hypothetical protein
MGSGLPRYRSGPGTTAEMPNGLHLFFHDDTVNTLDAVLGRL